MSTKKKIMIALLIIFSIFAIYGLYLYGQAENKYILKVSLKTWQFTKFKTDIKNGLCRTSENKPNCYSNLVQARGGIEFGSDIIMYTVLAFVFCETKTDRTCLFETTDALINQINIENLWVSKNIPRSDLTFKHFINLEVGIFDSFLRSHRKKLVDQYSQETDVAKKSNILNFLKVVDGKIQLMLRSRLPVPPA